jgi:murein DD-endopeptidase MepM/ murein hydrolase activator NlpD
MIGPRKITKYLFSILIIFIFANTTLAGTVEDIKQKIDITTQSRAAIQKEIDAYQKQLKDIGTQATTLQNAIKTLTATGNKISASIRLNKNRINTAELEIQKLALEIKNKEKDIKSNSDVIYELIREINTGDQASVVENMLEHKSLSEFWNDMESMYQIQNRIREKLTETKQIRDGLTSDKKETEDKKKELLTLKSDLEDQQAVLEINKSEKNNLLTTTKGKESNYKKLLAEKQALADSFDKELIQFESELKLVIDPKSVPSAGKGILSWPLDNIVVTQKFGHTDFANTTTAYGFIGHNGVDFRAPIGTVIKAALTGTVVGTGNTDTVCPGASYGKWVLVQHDNGLSTLYAHFSLIKVSAGQRVFTGDPLGLSGQTGFATGPHLHLGLFATQGVKIMSRKSTVCKGTYTMPVADLRAYLDPLLYL